MGSGAGFAVASSGSSAYQVALDQAQFVSLMEYLRYQTSITLFLLLVCSALLGSFLFLFLTRGWSRG